MPTKEESELVYLRRLKENNTKTIQRLTAMLQVRDHVIEEKDKVLSEVATSMIGLAMNEPSLKKYADEVRRVANEALKIGIGVR